MLIAIICLFTGFTPWLLHRSTMPSSITLRF